MVLGGAISERKLRIRGSFHNHSLLILLEFYVECSIHFLFIFLSNSSGMSLNTNFVQYEILPSGAMPPLGSALASRECKGLIGKLPTRLYLTRSAVATGGVEVNNWRDEHRIE